MPSPKKIQDYDEVMFELASAVAAGRLKEFEFDSESTATSTKSEFYAFRSALRKALEDADKVTIKQEGSKITFSRKESVFVSRLEDKNG